MPSGPRQVFDDVYGRDGSWMAVAGWLTTFLDSDLTPGAAWAAGWQLLDADLRWASGAQWLWHARSHPAVAALDVPAYLDDLAGDDQPNGRLWERMAGAIGGYWRATFAPHGPPGRWAFSQPRPFGNDTELVVVMPGVEGGTVSPAGAPGYPFLARLGAAGWTLLSIASPNPPNPLWPPADTAD